MPEMTSYPPGTPSWVDLATTDLDAAVSFYSGLFGWTAEREPNPEAHGYTQMTLRGRSVAGIGPVMAPEQPVVWTTYIAVADVDASVATAVAAGGTALAGPITVFDAGRLALLFDATGAAFGLWEPKLHAGAGLVNEPGALCWNELTVRDIDTAKRFYAAVFGWDAVSRGAAGSPFGEWQLGGRTVGGMVQMNEMWPPEVPSHWMVYFAVDDTDAAAARAERLGGKISVPPTDIPPGRFAVLNDPQGGFFSVITMAPSRPAA